MITGSAAAVTVGAAGLAAGVAWAGEGDGRFPMPAGAPLTVL